MSKEIKLIRLRDGVDIVAFITDCDDPSKVKVINPMTVEVRDDLRTRSKVLVMDHWLPIEVLEHDLLEITKEEIIGMSDPTDAFEEYYRETLKKRHELEAASQEGPSNEELMDILVSMDTPGKDLIQ